MSKLRVSPKEKLVREMYHRYDKWFKFTQFMQYVKVGNLDECWEWQGAKGTYGYGVFYWKTRKIYRTNVASYVFFKGNIPKRQGKRQLLVCHTCDNPPCVNPNHLFLGTAKDNMHDRDRKGRTSRGEDRHNAKLNEHKAHKIIKLYASGKYSQTTLGNKFGVHHTVISDIVNSKIWKNASSYIN